MTTKECPLCGDPVHSKFYALSRVDNKTHICSDCGTKEGLRAFRRALLKEARC